MEEVTSAGKICRLLRSSEKIGVPSDTVLAQELLHGITILCFYRGNSSSKAQLFVLTKPEDIQQNWRNSGCCSFYRLLHSH